MKIKNILIGLILLQITLQQNLQKYENGNQGTGPDNKVNGANNTWIGAQNSIDGNENKVKGDQNKISGNTNVVEGSNNVIGDVSPQEIARLQNQMAQKMLSRFAGLGIFGTRTTTTTNSGKTLQTMSNSITNPPRASNPKNNIKEETKTQNTRKQEIKSQQNIKKQQVTKSNDEKNVKSVKATEQSVQKQIVEVIKRSINNIVFRTYGGMTQENIISDWFNQNYENNQIKQVIFKRFNKDFIKQRRIFYSSLYRPPY